MRLDVLLVERGLAESRQRAQALILAGAARVDGKRVDKAGALVSVDASVEIAGERMKYASRAGYKLEGAIEDSGVAIEGRAALDIGSSTGGFTDCLLQRGARHVTAVDVTPEQLDWKLRQDPRVTLVERNARELRPEDVAEPPDIVTLDVSFISAAKVLPAVVPIARSGADFLILVKPQFELERGQVGRGGIVRDPALHRRAVEKIREAAFALGLEILGVYPSHLAGAEGNREFFLHARKPSGPAPARELL
jgi:23S rRNA (cytidine1920-2'-O)/16S rRNA (cytidine1409-2'-O)-methyltransferase